MSTTFQIFLAFLALSILLYVDTKTFTLNVYKKIGVIDIYYPKRYVSPSKLIKKQFKLKYNKMLRFYYYELFVANFYILLFAINSFVFAIKGFNPTVAGYLLLFTFSLSLLNTIISILVGIYYKSKIKYLFCDKSIKQKKKP